MVPNGSSFFATDLTVQAVSFKRFQKCHPCGCMCTLVDHTWPRIGISHTHDLQRMFTTLTSLLTDQITLLLTDQSTV